MRSAKAPLSPIIAKTPSEKVLARRESVKVPERRKEAEACWAAWVEKKGPAQKRPPKVEPKSGFYMPFRDSGEAMDEAAHKEWVDAKHRAEWPPYLD